MNNSNQMIRWITEMSLFRIGRPSLVGLLLSMLVASCALVEFPEPPTPIPLPTAAGQTPQMEPTATADSTEAVTETPTGSLPTPTLPPHAQLPPIGAGVELEIRWVSMVDEQTGWGIGEGPDDIERVLRTLDGGLTWQDVSPPAFDGMATEESRLVIVVDGPQSGWSLRYAPEEIVEPSDEKIAAVWRTQDGGESWTAGQPLNLPFVGSLGSEPYLRFGEPQQVWLMARAGGAGMHRYPVALLRSVDGGSTWEMVEDPFEGTGLQSCYKSGFAVQGGDDGLVTLESCPVEGAEVRFTRDGGVTWESQLLPAPEDQPSLFESAGCESRSPQMLSAADWALAVICRPFEGDPEPRWFLYRTTDGGETWRAQSYPGGDLLFLDSQTVWALARELHLSGDGGETWELVKRVSWDGQFSFVSEELGWAIARAENEIALVRTQDGGQTWRILEPEIAP